MIPGRRSFTVMGGLPLRAGPRTTEKDLGAVGTGVPAAGRCIICRETGDLGLQLSDIKPEFTRKNLSNIQSKAQVLAEMLNNSKIHPKLAFQYSGLFSDPEEAYRISSQYAEEQQRKMERSLRDELNTNRDTNITVEERNNDVSVSE